MNKLYGSNNSLIISILIVFSCLSCKDRQGVNISHELQELESYAIDIPYSPNLISDSILEDVFTLTGIKLYGLGEQAHGSSSLFTLKRRLFEFLVENRNCRTLLYEFSYRESLKLNRYVQGEDINLDSLVYDLYWIQSTMEFKDLLLWMREYNTGAGNNDKIGFIGIDCQLDMFKPGGLRDEIRLLDPGLAHYAKNILDSLASRGKPDYREMDSLVYNKILNEILNLETESVKYYNESLNRSPENKSIILHLIDCMRLSHNFLYSAYKGSRVDRDRFMADNTARVINYLVPEGTSVALWAHNSHLAVNSNMYGNRGPSMGYYLKEALGPSYLVCGTSFNRGEVIAVEEDTLTGRDTPPHSILLDTLAPAGSVNKLFNLAESDNFILPVNSIDSLSPLYEYLDTLRGFLGIGDFYRGNNTIHFCEDRQARLAEEYDIIFHINEIKPLTLSGKWSVKNGK